jgi:hypothetical protein
MVKWCQGVSGVNAEGFYDENAIEIGGTFCAGNSALRQLRCHRV